jgi:hypothetical protein
MRAITPVNVGQRTLASLVLWVLALISTFRLFKD